MPNITSIMRANAASCLAFGVLFITAPAGVAGFLGPGDPAPALLIAALGIALVANGCHLLWAARRDPPARTLVVYFTAGDFAWAAATLILVVGGVWITSIPGIVAALAIAAVVGAFGIAQIKRLPGRPA